MVHGDDELGRRCSAPGASGPSLRPDTLLHLSKGDGILGPVKSSRTVEIRREGRNSPDRSRDLANQAKLSVLDGQRPRRCCEKQSLLREVRVSLVIPTLNEARNLPHVFARLPRDLYEVVIVDGQSTDGTEEVALRLRPDAKIVRQSRKGKGDALASGFAACSGDVIVMIDADRSMDPGEIPTFVQALVGGAEFAKGSRFLPGGGSADITFVRRVGNAFLSSFVNLLFGTKYSDLCYGYNAFRRSVLDELIVDCPGFEVETLINIRVAKLGLRVAEVPSFESMRLHGSSNLRPVRDGCRVLRVVLRERLRRSRHRPVTITEPAAPISGAGQDARVEVV